MSALQLERHFFSRIELKSKGDGKPECTARVRATVGVAQATDNPRRFQLSLSVVIDQNPDTRVPVTYEGSTEVVGFFTVNDSYSEDPLRLVSVSGASMLYAAARELFCNLTSRGPFQMLTLPMSAFQPLQAVSAQTSAALGSVEAARPKAATIRAELRKRLQRK